MTQKTESELLFEQFCTDLQVPCTPIPRSGGKTPDYDLILGGNVVVAEMKQLDPNDKDIEMWDRVRSSGVASGWSEPGRRVRTKLNARTSKQLKARTNGTIPALLIVYDNGTFGGTDSTDIKTAMYGAETVTISHSCGNFVGVSGIHAGGGRKMTETCNTTLSAVALLHGAGNTAALSVFHNKYAKNPIDPNWFHDDRFRHFALDDEYFVWYSV